MVKQYAFLWHVVASEEAAASLCESAETEAPTGAEAELKLEQWLKGRQAACDVEDCACKGGGFVTEEVTPKMFTGGMTEHMIKI